MKWSTAGFVFLALGFLSVSPLLAEPSEPYGQGQLSLSTRLTELASRLEQTLTDSKTDWELLSQDLTSLSAKLRELQALSIDSEHEIESTRASLASLENSLKRLETENALLKVGIIGTAVIGVTVVLLVAIR